MNDPMFDRAQRIYALATALNSQTLQLDNTLVLEDGDIVSAEVSEA